jgi:hypothetical protein
MASMRWLGIRRRRPFPAGLNCSFCGKHRDEVVRLVAGPGVYICNECIVLAVGQLARSK